MRRIARSLAALAVAATTLGIAAAPAVARTATVTSFDGTQIHVNFFPAAKLGSGAKAPTVLLGPGWGQPGVSDENGKTDPATGAVGPGPLREAGYNVLTWDPRGFGQSTGTVEVDSPDFEARDVSVLLDWVAQQSEAQVDGPGDPRAGMAGPSYGGGIQLATAPQDKRVDVLVPSIAWHSLVTSLYKDQTAKTGWSSILYAVGQGHSLDPHIQSAYTNGLATGTIPPDDVEFFRSRGPGDRVGRIRVPTLFIQGTVDTLFSLDEGVTNYGIVKAAGVPTKMLWFCGGHGACLTDPGDVGRIQRDTLAWFAHFLRGDSSVDTGPAFEWLDQDGKSYSANAYPKPTGTPLTADGTGTLTINGAGGSGPVTPPPGSNAVASLAAGVTPAKAANAVNVTIPSGSTAQPLVGPPQLSLTYSGTAQPADTRVFAQVVDDATGIVLGNQITPIPVVLDGQEHTIARPLEIISATAKPGETFTLQLTPSTTAYNAQRSAGAMTFSRIHIELPVADLTAANASNPPSTAPATCAGRKVTLKLPRRYRGRVRRAKVMVGAKVVGKVKRRAKRVRVNLPASKRSVTVRVVLKLRNGHKATVKRRFAGCKK